MTPTDPRIVPLYQGGYAVYTDDGRDWSWHKTVEEAELAVTYQAEVHTTGHASPQVMPPSECPLTQRERQVVLIGASVVVAACIARLRTRLTLGQLERDRRLVHSLLRALEQPVASTAVSRARRCHSPHIRVVRRHLATGRRASRTLAQSPTSLVT